MAELKDTLEQGDVCSLFLLALLFCYLGHYVAAPRPTIYRRGQRVAGTFLLCYVLAGLQDDLLYDPSLLAARIIRGAVMAGVVLGCSWLVLTNHAIVCTYCADIRRDHRSRAQHRQQELQKAREQAAEAELRRRARLDWERDRPRRERAASEAQHQRELEVSAAKEAQRRRDAARHKTELLYDRHATLLSRRFPRARFDGHLATYLADTFSAELVEQRAAQLCTLIEEMAKTFGRRRYNSLEELHLDFEKCRADARLVFTDEDTLASMLSIYAMEEQTAITEFLRR